MLEKLLIITILSFFSLINISFAEETTDLKNNIIVKAFEERKKKLFKIIEWWELNQEIQKLEKELKTIEQDKNLDKELKQKLLAEIEIIKNTIEQKRKILNNEEFKNFFQEASKSIEIKNNLIEKLNTEIENNKIFKEKNKLLLEKLIQKQELEKKKQKLQDYKKYYIFFGFTLFLIILHIFSYLWLKFNKIDKTKWIYIKFFLIFTYTIFLIWFFFYLYPELSIFLIFISWYLLVINSHLIASFVWSIIILEKYKIWNIIVFWDFRWQIIKITTINTIVLPMTKEGIFANKPIIIPNFKLLKEEVIIDHTPEVFIHNYELIFKNEQNIDILQLVENIEQNILLKHLHYRLSSLAWSEESFRTSIWFNRYWNVRIVFTWRWDDILNKRIERKIVWLFERVIWIIKEEN